MTIADHLYMQLAEHVLEAIELIWMCFRCACVCVCTCVCCVCAYVPKLKVPNIQISILHAVQDDVSWPPLHVFPYHSLPDCAPLRGLKIRLRVLRQDHVVKADSHGGRIRKGPDETETAVVIFFVVAN